MSDSGEIWAITSYFNPFGGPTRLENYRRFKASLAVPLVTVELGYRDAFELRSSDADILLQIRGADLLWQKERLLNLALDLVPAACRKIAWLDCDIVFQRQDWAEIAGAKLDTVAMVHLFETRLDLDSDSLTGVDLADATGSTLVSIGSKIVNGKADHASFATCGVRQLLGQTNGLAWAADREILETHRFYDGCILGGGDQAMVGAAAGRIAEAAEGILMNEPRRRHYEGWAVPFHESVGGRIDFVPGCVFHLWHGPLQSRQSWERQQLLEDFDPFTDIALDGNRCWRWNSDKPELHQAVANYFRGRADAETVDVDRQ
jgi:hypothetical protein